MYDNFRPDQEVYVRIHWLNWRFIVLELTHEWKGFWLKRFIGIYQEAGVIRYFTIT